MSFKAILGSLVMSEWVTKPLGELNHLHIGGTPSRDKMEYWAEKGQEGFPWVSIADLKTRRIYKTKEKITKKGATSSNTKLISKGTLIMSFKLSLGKVAIADRDLYTNEAIVALPPIINEVSADFLYFALPEIAKSSNFDTAVKGATLNKEKLRVLEVRYPSCKKEQKAITDTLNALDTQIEQTEALIAKQENIRQGLMQDLFTRGVDETGQLRPAYEDAPHLYHETELGWLPKGWEVKPILSLLEQRSNAMRSGPFGSALLKQELVESGIPFLGIDNIFTEYFKPDFSRFVSPRKFLELNRYQVFSNDVIISIMGTVGRCCVVPQTKMKMLSSKHLWSMSFDQSKILSNLVCWQLNFSPWVSSWFRRETQGGIMDAIQSSTLKTTKLVVPDENSQSILNQIYINERKRTNRLEVQLKKSRLIKSGLMRDLLSGDVPVASLMKDDVA